MSITVEILQYQLTPGAGQQFHRIMTEQSVPLQRANGIDVVAFGNSLHCLDAYYLIRAFESNEQLDATLAQFYSSQAWLEGPRSAIVSMIDTGTRSVLALNKTAMDGLRTMT